MVDSLKNSSFTGEFKKLLEEYEEKLAQLEKAREEVSRLEHTFEEEVPPLRTALLQSYLDRQGLAVCSHRGYPLHEGEYLKVSLGIFPASKMRLLYRRLGDWSRNGVVIEGSGELLKLCPQHFPHYLNAWNDLPMEGDVTCEVVRQDGRLITIPHGSDITGVSVMKRPYPEAVYQYFGLPQLPVKLVTLSIG